MAASVPLAVPCAPMSHGTEPIAPLTAAEAEAIATAAALHHLRAASAGGPAAPQRPSNWVRHNLLAGVDRGPHHVTPWGDPQHWG